MLILYVSVLHLLICYIVKLINNVLIYVCLFRCSQESRKHFQSLITTDLCKLPYMQRIVSLYFVRQYNIFNILHVNANGVHYFFSREIQAFVSLLIFKILILNFNIHCFLLFDYWGYNPPCTCSHCFDTGMVYFLQSRFWII